MCWGERKIKLKALHKAVLFCKKITCNASACNQCEALYGIIPKGCMASSRRKPTRLRVITCSPAARLHTSRPRGDYMPSRRTAGLDKKSRSKERDFLVGENGFEPLKRSATDLQSAPFGHSGTLPYSVLRRRLMELVDGLEPPTC